MTCVPPSRKLTLNCLERRVLEQLEALADRLRLVRDLVGEPVEARDAVVLRHRVLVARVVVGLGERGRDVLHVRDQLVRERHDQPEVGHRLDRVAGGGDDVELRAAGAQLGQDLLVGAEAGDLDLRAVLLPGSPCSWPGRSSRPSWRAAGRPARPGRRPASAAWPPRSPRLRLRRRRPPPLLAGRAAAAGHVRRHRGATAGEQRLPPGDHALHVRHALVRDQDVQLVGSVGHLGCVLS